MMIKNTTLTAIEGLAVGHWADLEARTGCTVILCPSEGCVASGLALGSAPGSREYALLAPEKTVDRVHAILMTGGSAFGLDAATGVMRWLEQEERGYAAPNVRVPIVPTAVIFDFLVGNPKVRPNANSGYEAAQTASFAPVESGQIGVAAGAMVGKYAGYENASLGGLGSALIELGDIKVAALAVSNAIGDIVHEGQFIAGSKASQETATQDTTIAGTNTTVVTVATDAIISKAEARALAQSAHIGIAQATKPSHTVHDGDTAFVLSTGKKKLDSLMALSIAVQQVVSQAIVQGVKAANGIE